MSTWKYLPLVAALILLASAAEAAARGRRAARRPWAALAPSPAAATEHRQQLPPPQSPAIHNSPGYWSMQPELYPQWYGGFHGRMLQNYGYPPGDLGIRGMAW